MSYSEVYSDLWIRANDRSKAGLHLAISHFFHWSKLKQAKYYPSFNFFLHRATQCTWSISEKFGVQRQKHLGLSLNTHTLMQWGDVHCLYMYNYRCRWRRGFIYGIEEVRRHRITLLKVTTMDVLGSCSSVSEHRMRCEFCRVLFFVVPVVWSIHFVRPPCVPLF